MKNVTICDCCNRPMQEPNPEKIMASSQLTGSGTRAHFTVVIEISNGIGDFCVNCLRDRLIKELRED